MKQQIIKHIKEKTGCDYEFEFDNFMFISNYLIKKVQDNKQSLNKQDREIIADSLIILSNLYI